ncbi:MAG: DAK2 domain-containing protein [Christensenellaceae bacterium]
MVQNISGDIFKKMVYKAANLLEQNRDSLDALNVFPVPDGDTGTNMSLTMITAAKEVAAVDENDRKGQLNALSMGALKGARGNSGVILSQIFAGFSNAVIHSESEFNTELVATAFRSAADHAYKAVMKPKEGTILTIIKSMADAAELMAGKTTDIRKQMSYIVQKGEETLKQTPEMLPVLKEAGVVDAGGAGLIMIMMGFKSVLYGEDVDVDATEHISDGTTISFSDMVTGNEEIEFGYCTEFFIKNLYPETQLRDIDTYRNNLSKIGDSVLVVGDLGLIKTHVHTNEPGLALQYAQILGELSQIKIDNMREQHRHLVVEEEVEQKGLAVVAVIAGDGIREIFADWQVNNFVEGGQSMNPSTEDILKAIEEAPSSNVIVLPNNKNIILAAEQAAGLSEKNVKVIKTKTLPQGVAAAVAYDPEADMDTNAQSMKRAISDIKTGLITNAVRDTKMNGNSIKKDEVIGIFENDIVANDASIDEVAEHLLDRMVDDDSELITIYYGEDISEDSSKELNQKIGQRFKTCDVELLYGGQPIYQYMIAVE